MSSADEKAQAFRQFQTPNIVHVHPSVLLTIVDAHERRSKSATHVIGCLMGKKIKSDCIEVVDCIPIPFEETAGGGMSIVPSVLDSFYKTHRKSFPNEKLVGWFSSNMDNLEMSANFHRWWIRYVTQPVFLAVDCMLTGPRMNIKSFVGIPTTGSLEAIYGGEGAASAFFLLEIPLEIMTWQTERATLDVIQNARMKPEKAIAVNDDVGAIMQVTLDMKKMLDKCMRYVNGVVDKSHEGKPDVGRLINDLLQSVPALQEEDYEKFVNSSRKDLLMSMFVSQIVESQLHLQEKINQVVFASQTHKSHDRLASISEKS